MNLFYLVIKNKQKLKEIKVCANPMTGILLKKKLELEGIEILYEGESLKEAKKV